MSLPFPLASAGSRLGGHHHGRTSSGGGSTTTAAAAGEASKADSFSYVAEPTLRFVTDLPLRPENESEANLDRETSLVSASAAPVVVVDSPSPLLAASSSSSPASSEANHPADPNHAKRKRRVSLGALLHHHKKSGGSHGSASAPAGALPASSIDSARASPVPRPAPGAMPSSSSNGGPTMQPLASDAPMSMSPSEFLAQTEPEHISQGPHFFPARSRRSELGAVEAHPPPISHHPTASPPLSQSISAGRSSLDSSEEQRPTLTETEAFSGSSQGSLVGATSCPSVASTAPTSPGSHAQRHAREDSLDRNGIETFANAAKLASTPDPTRTNGAGAGKSARSPSLHSRACFADAVLSRSFYYCSRCSPQSSSLCLGSKLNDYTIDGTSPPVLLEKHHAQHRKSVAVQLAAPPVFLLRLDCLFNYERFDPFAAKQWNGCPRPGKLAWLAPLALDERHPDCEWTGGRGGTRAGPGRERD